MIFGRHNVMISNHVRQIVLTCNILNASPEQVDTVGTLYNNELTVVRVSWLNQAATGHSFSFLKELHHSAGTTM
jgi:hypothetical protein